MKDDKKPKKKNKGFGIVDIMGMGMTGVVYGVFGALEAIGFYAAFFALKILWKKQIVYKPHGKTEVVDRE